MERFSQLQNEFFIYKTWKIADLTKFVTKPVLKPEWKKFGSHCCEMSCNSEEKETNKSVMSGVCSCMVW